MDVWLYVHLPDWRMCVTLGDKDIGQKVWVDIPEERAPYISGEKEMVVGGVQLPKELFAALDKEIMDDPLIRRLQTERMLN
jgi:hypothetical protein